MSDYKIFKKGNYLVVVFDNDDYVEEPSSEVTITKSKVSSTLYTVNFRTRDPLKNIAFANILDENGDPYADVDTWETWYSSNTGFNPATPASVTAVADDLQTHEANNSNPHSVTKTQVGLGNVDNTSDVNKPVSTAQQTALDLKLTKTSNLSDLSSVSTARTNLGLGTLATQNGTFSGTSSGTNTGDQTLIVGITGTKTQFNTAVSDGDIGFTDGKLSQFASTTSAELASVLSDETGTGSVVFSASPALTGSPTSPTQSELDNSTKIANTAYVDKLRHRALKKSSFGVRASNATRVSIGVTTSGFGTLSNNTDTVTGLTNYATSTVAGSFAGLESTAFTELPINSNADFQAVIKTNTDITAQRIWVGLISGTLLDNDNQSGVNVAFRYSTVAGDTGWKAIVDDGTTQVVSANIGTITTNTYYYLSVRCDYANNNYYFSVNGSVETVVQANTTITTGTKLGWCVEMTNPSTGSRDFNFSRLDCEHN